MILRNIALLAVFATSANAGFEFKAGGVAGLARRTAQAAQAYQIGAANVNLSTTKITKKGFFGALMGHANIKKEKMHFGAFAAAFFSNANPKNEKQAFDATPNLGTTKFSTRGITLMVGPKVGFSVANLMIDAGVGLTLASHKMKFTGTTPATDITLQNKMFRTLGAMPFVTVGYAVGAAEVSAFVGHNISKNPKLTNKSSVTAAPTNGAVDTQVFALGNATDGMRIKTGTTYFGVGVTVKLG